MKRYCRVCNKLLPAVRYFNCVKCKPNIDIGDEGVTVHETEELDEHIITMLDGIDDIKFEEIDDMTNWRTGYLGE